MYPIGDISALSDVFGWLKFGIESNFDKSCDRE